MLGFKSFILKENWFSINDNKHLKRRESLDKQLGKPKLTYKIKQYIENSKPVNTALLSGSDHPDIEHIDDFIQKNKLPTRLTVYSALGKNTHKQLIDQGRSPTYISSSPHKDVAISYSTVSDDGYHHIAHIELPEKSSASHLGTHENEVLIGRNQKISYHGSFVVEVGDKRYKIHKFSA